MCSYFEPVDIPEYSRDNPSDADSLESDDGYDYQEPNPTIIAVNPINDVGHLHSLSPVPKIKLWPSFQNESIVCERHEDYCYALWSIDGNQNVTLKKQGKWE